jgi:hypothetical protein
LEEDGVAKYDEIMTIVKTVGSAATGWNGPYREAVRTSDVDLMRRLAREVSRIACDMECDAYDQRDIREHIHLVWPPEFAHRIAEIQKVTELGVKIYLKAAALTSNTQTKVDIAREMFRCSDTDVKEAALLLYCEAVGQTDDTQLLHEIQRWGLEIADGRSQQWELEIARRRYHLWGDEIEEIAETIHRLGTTEAAKQAAEWYSKAADQEIEIFGRDVWSITLEDDDAAVVILACQARSGDAIRNIAWNMRRLGFPEAEEQAAKLYSKADQLEQIDYVSLRDRFTELSEAVAEGILLPSGFPAVESLENSALA